MHRPSVWRFLNGGFGRRYLAAWVLNGRLQRWTNVLQPLLRGWPLCFGLQMSDLLPFLQAQDLFRPEAWLELTQPPRCQAGQSFLLFRQTLGALHQQSSGCSSKPCRN